ncbi:MAG: hypothetical protein CMG60_00760 [Candidatus Marinimicrobia bacterium]|nr:hypothetical protein [Candidatus Neomarinimicrobiota bacterium]|tara:strand:- start:12820 stop:13539 length:720 start_codon:yes stop_codon:yes gene_type:complete
MTFSKITNIDPTIPSSYNDSIFLSFDFDWCHDLVLQDSIELVNKYNVEATWFVTHNTRLLSNLLKNEKFELGIHPNFNKLLQNSNNQEKNIKDVFDKFLNLVPDSKVLRSHSLVQSSHILQEAVNRNFTHDCNDIIPHWNKITLKPWIHPSGLYKCPHFWEDDVNYVSNDKTSITYLMQKKGLKIFDFHPIHIYLNTNDLDLYEQTRRYHNNPIELLKYRFNGYGVRNQLIEILELSDN